MLIHIANHNYNEIVMHLMSKHIFKYCMGTLTGHTWIHYTVCWI